MADYSNELFDLYFASDFNFKDYLSGLKIALDAVQKIIPTRNKRIAVQASVKQNSASTLGGTAPGAQYTIQYNSANINIPSALYIKDYAIMDIISVFYHQNNRWTFNGGNYDFVAIAVHEIFHGLGFYSNIEPFFQYFGLYTTFLPQQDIQPVFLPPTIFDYHISCNNVKLLELLEDYTTICVSKDFLSNSSQLAIKVAAYELVPESTRDKMNQYMSTPNSCTFESNLINFELFSGTDLKPAVMSHSSYTEKGILMHAKYKDGVTYDGVEYYGSVLNVLGYDQNVTFEVAMINNCKKMISDINIQQAQSRIDAGEFRSSIACPQTWSLFLLFWLLLIQ